MSKLSKPAQVGGTIFGVGVSEHLVVERAQREHEYQQTPEAQAARLDRIAAFRKVLDAPRVDLDDTYQGRVRSFMLACFGPKVAADLQQRNHRFIEEALELVQANGCTASEAHQVVDYVFGRPVGDPHQEVCGTLVTLAALCLAAGLDMAKAGEDELARVWTRIEQIRAKHRTKPRFSPLPGSDALKDGR